MLQLQIMTNRTNRIFLYSVRVWLPIMSVILPADDGHKFAEIQKGSTFSFQVQRYYLGAKMKNEIWKLLTIDLPAINIGIISNVYIWGLPQTPLHFLPLSCLFIFVSAISASLQLS